MYIDAKVRHFSDTTKLFDIKKGWALISECPAPFISCIRITVI